MTPALPRFEEVHAMPSSVTQVAPADSATALLSRLVEQRKVAIYHFTLGDYQGPYTIYFPDGKVEERGTYKFDERDGLYEKFYPNGAPFIRETYQMGVLNGDATYYSKDGKSKTYHFYEGLPHD